MSVFGENDSHRLSNFLQTHIFWNFDHISRIYNQTNYRYNKISLSRHEQACSVRLRFEIYLSHHWAWWWEKYHSKRSLIKHTCPWRDKPIVLWTLTSKNVFTYNYRNIWFPKVIIILITTAQVFFFSMLFPKKTRTLMPLRAQLYKFYNICNICDYI